MQTSILPAHKLKLKSNEKPPRRCLSRLAWLAFKFSKRPKEASNGVLGISWLASVAMPIHGSNSFSVHLGSFDLLYGDFRRDLLVFVGALSPFKALVRVLARSLMRFAI